MTTTRRDEHSVSRFARRVRVAITLGLHALLAPIGSLMFAVLYVVWRGDPVRRARRMQAITAWSYRVMHRWLTVFGVTSLDLQKSLAELPDGPCVVVANHPTLMDVTALLGLLGGASTVAKPDLFERRSLRPLLHGAGVIRGTGSDPLSAQRVVDDATAALAAGFRLVIFPEGTRSPRDALLPFGRAAFEIACRARVPVVSVTITCAPLWLSKDRPFLDPPHPTPVLNLRTLAVDDPARVDYDSRALRQVVEARFRNWMRLGRPHSPTPIHEDESPWPMPSKTA